MPLYFLLLDAARFHEQIHPALSASWRSRSFEPCRSLCAELLTAARDFTPDIDQPLLAQVAAQGMPFDRLCWRTLVGEVLLFAAADMPLIQTAPETLRCILAPEKPGFLKKPGFYVPREHFTAIEQVHFGTRDLCFGGGYYRPDAAGWNDVADVTRLTGYLDSIDPGAWQVTQLTSLKEMDDDERADELAFVQEWFPVLRDMYRRGQELGQVIVCEVL